MQKWLEVFQYGTVGQAIYDRKEDCAKRYIYPRIGDSIVSEVTAADLNQILTQTLGFGAVLFEGNIDFYGKSGFDYASKFDIRYHDLPEGADSSFFLCKELKEGYLGGISGVYQTSQGYYVDNTDVEEFDKQFPNKEKRKLPGQIF